MGRLGRRFLLWVTMFSLVVATLVGGAVPAWGLEMPVLMSPAEGDRFRSNDDILVKWSPVVGAAYYDVNVVEDATGKAVISEPNIGSVTQYTIRGGTLKGTQYYRVRVSAYANDGKQMVGYWVKILVISAVVDRPVITRPQAGEMLDSGAVTIEWTAVSAAVSYSLQLKDKATGTQVYQVRNLTGTVHTVPAVNAVGGRTYEAQVIAVDATGASLTSDSLTFGVLLDRPVVRFPAPEQVVPAGDVAVTWDAVKGATEYYVAAWDLKTSQQVAFERIMNGTKYTMKALPPFGEYRVAVGAYAGISGRWSQDVTFRTDLAALNPPKVTAPVNNGPALAFGNVTARWSTVTGATQYRVVLVQNGKELLRSLTTATSYTIQYSLLQLGKQYQLTVTAIGGDKEASQTTTFQMEATLSTPLQTPVITTPAPTGVTVPQGAVTVRWDAVPAADSYRVTLLKGAQQLASVTITDTSYTISKSVLQPGERYQVTVAASGSGQETSSRVEFMVDTQVGSVPVPPVISAPTDNGAPLPLAPVTVRWGEVTGVTTYRVKLTDVDSGSVLFETPVSATVYTIPGTQLTPYRNYEVTVTAVMGRLTASSSVRFSTQASEMILPPVITAPQDGSRVPFGSVPITWQEVRGASSYRVVVTDLQNGARLLSTYTTGTTYTIGQARLEQGKQYGLSVTAILGTQEAPTSIRFSMTTPRLRAPAITAPINGRTMPAGDVTLRWKAVTGATGYKVSVTQVGTGETVLAQSTAGTEYTLPEGTFQPGQGYLATVSAVSADEEVSAAVSFWMEIGPGQAPPALGGSPRILAPAAGAHLPMGDVTVRWQAVAGATGYTVTLREAGAAKALAETTVSATSFVVAESRLVADKSYEVTVTARNGGQSDTVSFSTVTAVRIEPPVGYTELAGRVAGERMMALGVLRGKSAEDPLALKDGITRAELVTIIVRAFGKESEANLMKGQAAFPDTADHWASGYVAEAVQLVKAAGSDPIGLPDGRFDPDASLTPAQAVAFLMKFLGVKRDAALTWPDDYLSGAVKAGLLRAEDRSLIAGAKEGNASRGLVFYLLDRAFYTYKLADGTTFYTRHVDPTAPVLTVNLPAISGATVRVSGTVEGASEVTINDERVTWDAQGQFSAVFMLPASGGVDFVVVARDLAGNVSEKSVKLTR